MESAAVTTTLFWLSPSPDPELATRRILLERGGCWEPVRMTTRRHPELASLVEALFAFVTDGIHLAAGQERPLPLLHHAFDQAWALHARDARSGEPNGSGEPAGAVPLVAYLVIPTLHIVAAELAGVRLCRGVGVWSPQTGEPLQNWLQHHAGPVTLHKEPTELPQQARLRWRLYNQLVPESLRSMLDDTLPDVLRIRESDAAELSARQARLRRRKSQLAEC